ncbi:Ig-like domain-containing protein [Nocardioides sp. R-C-SC26]|uniref:Ig-like domain-containing protein n=1 Tax=Nocardioides sp. R-C-SC26 TaxID=2870414 RepID=UPI001E453F85|nr:Ig-like domain-containing protein [Nocardioides sp. R-C-SC26]
MRIRTNRRSSPPVRTPRTPALTLLLVAGLTGALAPALGFTPSAHAATTPNVPAPTSWEEGSHDEDQIVDCITSGPSTGVSANVGWAPVGNRVPRVGEPFYVRLYAGLVGLPCSGKVAVVPEILRPAGVEFADEVPGYPVRWSLTRSGETPRLRTGGLGYHLGVNGGVTVEAPGDEAWVLRQGDVLEVQVPVVAERGLKGPATQRPECQSRREGTRPCPVAQAGDHLQVAFTVGGHGGTKSYVTPYVALFADGAGTPGPGTPGAAPSRVKATYVARSTGSGSATVVVSSSAPAVGALTVRDGARVIARGRVERADQGRVRLRLPRLTPGVHRLSTRFEGSRSVAPSTSPITRVTVRGSKTASAPRLLGASAPVEYQRVHTVSGWGGFADGQLRTPRWLRAHDVAAIAAGDDHSLALTHDAGSPAGVGTARDRPSRPPTSRTAAARSA